MRTTEETEDNYCSPTCEEPRPGVICLERVSPIRISRAKEFLRRSPFAGGAIIHHIESEPLTSSVGPNEAMNTRRQLSQDQLNAHLPEQINFLEASATSFDAGFEGEAKRLAVTLRVLLHDRGGSKSLLGQLGMLDRKFLDTALEFDEANRMTHGGLVFIAVGPPSTRFVAMLDDMPAPNLKRQIDFAEWWNEPVFVDRQRRKLSRKQLILTAAEQDGGAHVDPGLDPTYFELTRNNALGWIVKNDKREVQMDGPEKAAIRQIAHEVLKTLKPDYRKNSQHQSSIIVGGMSFKQGSSVQTQKIQPVERPQKTPRNAPCHCGSGKKFKHCHGRLTG
jgi:SEC-C motif